MKIINKLKHFFFFSYRGINNLYFKLFVILRYNTFYNKVLVIKKLFFIFVSALHLILD
jgi:hypothetical protein